MSQFKGRNACAVALLCLSTALCARAQTFTVLHSFSTTDGADPGSSLVQTNDGFLYGTTAAGGSHGAGAVYKISTSGTLTTLYNFCSDTGCTDGSTPSAALVQANDGNFYGVTSSGGANDYGTVFKITSGGSLTVLHSFDFTDGAEPLGALIQGSDGNLYGTTYQGGAHNAGNLFRISLTGTISTVYSFCSESGCADGKYPVGGIFQAANGNFYGTTYLGANNYGTVFEITSAGALTTLYAYGNDQVGAYSQAALVAGANGTFYGTTVNGGTNSLGTVFKVTGTTLSDFYNLCSKSKCTDGSGPYGALVLGSDGNFYGTTYKGGASGFGSVFRLTSAATLTTVHSFSGGTNGSLPVAAVIQDTDGNFYGTTSSGGTGGAGIVFRLATSLKSFVAAVPAWGSAGTPIEILGSDLTGATSVTFNGVAATFTVVSAFEITTTVPSGAKSGQIKVVTPKGTFSSNVAFQVIP